MTSSNEFSPGPNQIFLKEKFAIAVLIPLTALAFFCSPSNRKLATLSENATVAENMHNFGKPSFQENHAIVQKSVQNWVCLQTSITSKQWFVYQWSCPIASCTRAGTCPQRKLHPTQAMRTPVGTGSNVWSGKVPDNVGGRTHPYVFAPGSSTRYLQVVEWSLWVNNNITSSATQWQQVTGVPATWP